MIDHIYPTNFEVEQKDNQFRLLTIDQEEGRSIDQTLLEVQGIFGISLIINESI